MTDCVKTGARGRRLLGLLVTLAVGAIALAPGAARAQMPVWTAINLPHWYNYPWAPGSASAPFYLPMPPPPVQWFWEADCGVNRSTSRRNVSDYLYGIKGLEFRGTITSSYATPVNPGEDDFAYYFTTNYCYNGGNEYGFFVRPKDGLLVFYQSINANLGNQYWAQQIIYGGPSCNGAPIDPSREKFYEAYVNSNGDFQVVVIDPYTWVYDANCYIPRQSWMPNMYGAAGYVTVGAVQNTGTNYGGSQFSAYEIKVGK